MDCLMDLAWAQAQWLKDGSTMPYLSGKHMQEKDKKTAAMCPEVLEYPILVSGISNVHLAVSPVQYPCKNHQQNKG